MNSDEVSEIKQHLSSEASRLEQQFTELRRQVETQGSELKRHLGVVGDSLRGEIRLVAEGFVAVDAKIDREVGSLRQEMHGEFAETRAMIRLSYAELDRRIQTLEAE